MSPANILFDLCEIIEYDTDGDSEPFALPYLSHYRYSECILYCLYIKKLSNFIHVWLRYMNLLLFLASKAARALHVLHSGCPTCLNNCLWPCYPPDFLKANSFAQSKCSD